MKLRKRAGLTACVALAVAVLLCGCKAEPIPYEINDGDNYKVSVRYDANGGYFTTNTTVITDSYNASELPSDGNGNVTVALLSPDAAARGTDAFAATRNGYFLAGWYAEKNEDGTYGAKWDFATDTLTVETAKITSSADPVLTLYAAWLPRFEVEFVTVEGEAIGTYAFEPNGEPLQAPQWDAESGALDMFRFPERNGYTYRAAYYDAEKTRPVGETVEHPGTVNLENATAANTKLTLYTEWDEGNWFHIYTAEQFLDNASVNGNYVLHADLDFTGEAWPSSLMHGNFGGSIIGNGHTLKNITLEQTNASKQNTGLFGQLTADATLTDVTFENVTLAIKGGTRKAGACFGLLCGNLSSEATVTGLQIKTSRLQIDSGSYFGVADYAIGLVCGFGQPTETVTADIACEVTGDNPDALKATVTDGQITLEFVD